MTNWTEAARQATADRQAAAWAQFEAAERRRWDAWNSGDREQFEQASAEFESATREWQAAQAAAFE
jgi:hypothetical protein